MEDMFRSKLSPNGLTISGSDLVNLNTITNSAAFGSALLLTILFNYNESLSGERITKNEFFPSIQDSIGQFYPGKSIFQILIGVVSFISLVYYVVISSTIKAKSPKTSIIFAVTLISKLLSLLIFANVPFHDDHRLNNNSLVIYFISSGALMYFVQSRITSRQLLLNDFRMKMFWIYMVVIANAAVTFYRHQMQGVSFQYSLSSICQWIAVALDIYFESLFIHEIRHLSMRIGFPLDKSSNHV